MESGLGAPKLALLYSRVRLAFSNLCRHLVAGVHVHVHVQRTGYSEEEGLGRNYRASCSYAIIYT